MDGAAAGGTLQILTEHLTGTVSLASSGSRHRLLLQVRHGPLNDAHAVLHVASGLAAGEHAELSKRQEEEEKKLGAHEVPGSGAPHQVRGWISSDVFGECR